MQFKAFKPAAMNKIAQAMGYQGDMNQFQQFIEQDPARQARMQQFTNAAQKMAQGGAVKKFAPGGAVTPTSTKTGGQTIGEATVERMYQPAVPVGGVTQAATTPVTAAQELQQGTGALTGTISAPTAIAGTAFATGPQQTQAAQMQATQAAPAVVLPCKLLKPHRLILATLVRR